MKVEILPVGDMAIQVFYDAPITEDLHYTIQQTSKLIIDSRTDGITEMVPGFQSITIYYNPLLTTFAELAKKVEEITGQAVGEKSQSQKEVMLIPTCYGGGFGEDLQRVASLHNLSPHEVISLHTSVDYLVYMIGFLPGFPYLKGLKEEISTPRLFTPRLHVPRGAVGIGGNQTGIYPLASPGGWNLIGRTPIRLFDPMLPTPFLLKTGDYIRFYPITEEEFFEIEELVKKKRFQVERRVIPLESN
ncbi:5-oxoprolinase subunit PxpB [Fredinandcohnia humi]